MNIIEMHAAVMQGVDKVHAQVADTLLSGEIDLELNKAIQQFISSRFQKNNKYKSGFEESQKRRDDLRSLVVEDTLNATFKEVISDYNNEYPVFVDTCTLPGNYMFYINLQADLWRSERCVALPYLVLNNQDEYYFAIDWNAGIGQNVDGLSTSYITSLIVVDRMPDVLGGLSTISTDSSGEEFDVVYNTLWTWGESWNQDGSAFTSNNPQSIYPANLNQVLGDILTYGVSGLIGNVTEGGLNPNPGSYQDGIGPDLEDIGIISVPNAIIYPWDASPTEDQDGGTVPSIYSSDMSNGWLSYVLAVNSIKEVVYQTPLRVSMQSFSKRYPSSENSELLDWTDMGILKETNPVKLVQFDDVYSMTKDPFNKTKYSSPLATMRGNHIDLYTDESFVIDKLKLTYIRMPNIVEAPNSGCDLPLHTHEEVVKMAVSSILEGISDPRYKTHQLEVDKME
mgnify:CR=1 FL=1